ncbi:MAG: tetratricopeptide repeat protein [Candidatus Thiodiazotropha sp.]
MKPLARLAGLLLLMAAQVAIAADDFVGSSQCISCHESEGTAWRGSHHDLAMAEVTESTVLGDFNNAAFTAHGVTTRFYRKDGAFHVQTDGPDGKLHDYRVRYTFGWYPLQQYLVEFPGGRYQALGLAWDSRSREEGGQHWFHLYPDEPMTSENRLHWTQRDQTWNYQCAECHSTRLEKNYDVATDTYHTRFEEINVACEACHGPGSEHLAWARMAEQNPEVAKRPGKGLVLSLGDTDGGAWGFDAQQGKPVRSVPRSQHIEIELCARCHSRRGAVWDDYRHGEPLSNTHRLALLEPHLYFPDGQIRDEVYVYGSFLQSRMYQAGVTCSDCHEPHSLKLRAQGNDLCARCHLATRYDATAHHHHQAESEGAACTACHMPQRVYMVNDWRADHSMRVPRPDLSERLGTPNACNDCHSDKTSAWAADAVEGWYPKSAYRGRHFADALHAAETGARDAGKQLLEVAADADQPGIVRATAVERLRDHPQSRSLFTIQRLLSDPDPLVRAAAVRFLDLTDVRTQVDQGWPLLDDPDRVVRLDTARLLAPLLRQRLPDKYRTQLEQAVEAYKRAESVNADRPESQMNLGLIALAEGNHKQAESAYRTALQLDPGFAPGYVNLADLYRQRGRDQQGEAVLRAGLAALGEDAGIEHALGLLLVRQKRLDDALPYLRKAADHAQPQDQSRYAYVYALSLQGAGDIVQAIQVLDEANQRHPGNAEILSALVSLHEQQGDRDLARRYAEELKQMSGE